MKKIGVVFVCVFLLMYGEVLAQQLAVKVEKANIRSGPGIDHEVLWSVGKYYPVRTIKKSGNWYKIRDFEDDQGWIHESLLQKVSAIIVKVPLANVRDGATTKARLLFHAEKGVSFKRLAVKGNWVKVQHADGEIGWIHNSLVWGL